jgi:roadblock/LC7 domain-containing protein
MLENVNGKLMVYASSFTSEEKRMRFIRVAAEKMAKVLKVNFEVVTLKEKFTPIYVYYKNGDEEPVPIYCDKDGKADEREIYNALRNMIFVLSFHPKYSGLRRIRKDVMLFS